MKPTELIRMKELEQKAEQKFKEFHEFDPYNWLSPEEQTEYDALHIKYVEFTLRND